MSDDRPRGMSVSINDGLERRDALEYAAQAPNNTDSKTWRNWYLSEFKMMLNNRLEYIDTVISHLTKGNHTIEHISEGITRYVPGSYEYYAIKYKLHALMADEFEASGDTQSRDREIYLMGQTWADGKFASNYKEEVIKLRSSRAKGGDGFRTVNADRADDARKATAEYQRLANQIWRRNPDWSAANVALEIVKKNPGIGAKADTIRRKISKPEK